MPSRLLLVAALSLAPLVSVFADPNEQVTAWNDAPVGFQWDQLGPRNTAVDPAAYAEIRYVSVTTGSDETGDGSKARPWRSLRRALGAAVGEGRAAVFVAAGLYQEGTLALRPRVDLFGGFAPGTWARDIFRTPTVLSGGGKNRVLTGAGDCRLDGFVVEDGLARACGGALYCHDCSPAITNNVFRRNRVLEPEGYTHDTRRRRQRGIDGGAIGLDTNANADIRHNLFHDNETGVGDGGAIGAREDCIPIIAHNVFWGNRAGVTDKPATLSSNGGAVSLLFSSRAAVFHNLFVANEALGESDGGALFCEYFSWPEVRYNAFLNNHAEDDGAGLDNQKFSYPKVKANLFYGNRADGSGGGMHLDDSLVDVENNVFAYNHASKEGGGFGGTHGWYHAINNTVVYNEAGQDGGGLHIVNVKNTFLRPPTFHNNLFAFNKPEQVLIQCEVDASYNLVHPGGFSGGYYNFTEAPAFRDDARSLAVGAPRQDPATFTTELPVRESLAPGSLAGRIVRLGGFWSLVRDNTADAIRVWGLVPEAAGGRLEVVATFHLTPNSRAVDGGVYPDFAPFDIDGEPRYTPNVDIGADEYHATPIGHSR
jgi:hypothetical protein